MAVHIDESDGRRFVRYTSADSKESVEEFVAENGLVVDWSRVVLSSTGTINGRPIELYQLPIADGSLLGTVPDTFPASSLLFSLQRELEGDGYLRALKSDLEAGHKIQRVTFETATDLKPVRYVFLLSRLGTLVSHEVPAGGLAVEHLLLRRRQRLASVADESLRAGFLLDRACQPFAVFGRATSQLALRTLAGKVGGPQSGQVSGQRVDEESIIHAALESMLEVLESTLSHLVTGLTLDLGYRMEEAGNIADDALARLIKSG